MFHYLQVISRIILTKTPFKKTELLLTYCRLLSKSIAFHKLDNRNTETIPLQKILGFDVRVLSYPQIINLFEEIFIYNVYAFSPNTTRPVILDCGSNIGLSILYFKKLYPECFIKGFEPDPEAFEILSENISRNKLKDVEIFNVALHDSERQLDLFKNTVVSGSLTTSIVPSANKVYTQTISGKQLSGFISDNVDLLKIDVEGSELKIIDDLIASQKINFVDQIIIEYHPAITNEPVSKLIALMTPSGFSGSYKFDEIHPGATELMVYFIRPLKTLTHNNRIRK